MRRKRILSIGVGILMVLGATLGVTLATMVNAHSGDRTKIHACANLDNGKVRLVGPNNDCGNLPGSWVPMDIVTPDIGAVGPTQAFGDGLPLVFHPALGITIDPDIYNDGPNVGIGTFTPSERLSVVGIVESLAGGFKFPDGTVQSTAAIGISGWELTGNAGTTAGVNFLGTTDDEPLELRVNGVRTLRLEPNATSSNIIIGYSGNSISEGVVGATISGGGALDDFGGQLGGQIITEHYGTIGDGFNNTINGVLATISGGADNLASESVTTIGGGQVNVASGFASTVGGGHANDATGLFSTVAGGGATDFWDFSTGNRATDRFATVGGGGNNQAGTDNEDHNDAPQATVSGGADNTASGPNSTIGGGFNNTASGPDSTIGGGTDNIASDRRATVSGGIGNSATGPQSTVGGGLNNVASLNAATVGGGGDNEASEFHATVSGGEFNTASALNSTVGGGQSNTASGSDSTVGGGQSNTASGIGSTVAGGANNTAAGDLSFVAGRRGVVDVTHDGVFLFADTNEIDFNSAAANEFAARATGGFRFVTGIDGTTGVPTTGCDLPGGSGSFACTSDRNAKANFSLVNGREILELVSQIPIESWNYKSQDASIRHIGPMAQDFYKAFGVGEDDTRISMIDSDGVALAAVKGLYEIVKEKDSQIAALEARLETLEQSADANGTSAGLLSYGTPITWMLLIGGLLIGALVIGRRRIAHTQGRESILAPYLV